jgi:NTE family protein
MLDEHVDATRQAGKSSERALVLAGGGAAGNAWELGLIAGLSDARVDVLEADLIIGTSAGSTVAAQITSGTRPADLYAAILAEVPQPQASDARSDRGRAPSFSGPSYLEWSDGIIGSAEDASDMRRRMGAAALELEASDGSRTVLNNARVDHSLLIDDDR